MRYAILPDGDWTRVKLEGNIDESIGEVLREIRSLIKTKGVVFYTAEIGHINSIGISTWIAHMQDFSDLEIAFVDCPYALVTTARVIPTFLPGTIMSFQLPYYCETCGSEEPQFHVNQRDEVERLGGFKMAACRHCRNLMEADDSDLIALFRFPMRRGA